MNFTAPIFVAGMALVSAASVAVDAAPSAIVRQLAREAQAVVALDVASVTPVDPAEKASRLQEFWVDGTVTRCFKGNVPSGSRFRYGLFSEGKPRMAAKTIVFLRRAKRKDAHWTAVDGPIFDDVPTLQHGLATITPGCKR